MSDDNSSLLELELYVSMREIEEALFNPQNKPKTQQEILTRKTQFETDFKNFPITTKLCCICWINKKNIILNNCNHLCVCEECILDVCKYQNDPKCPICHSNFTEYKQIFYVN